MLADMGLCFFTCLHIISELVFHMEVMINDYCHIDEFIVGKQH